MAQPTTFSFGKGTIEVGDGETPEVFSKVCGFNSIEMSLKKDTNDTTVPDCDDPDAPAWKQRDVTSIELMSSRVPTPAASMRRPASHTAATTPSAIIRP